MRLNEPHHVGHVGVKRGCRLRAETVVNRLAAVFIVERRNVGRGWIDRERRTLHSQRIEYGALQIRFERFAGHFLDQQLQDQITAAGVLPLRAGRIADTNLPRMSGRRIRMPQVFFEARQFDARRESGETEPVRQTRGMAQQTSHRYAVVAEFARRQLPTGEIARHRRIQIDLARFDQRHHRPGGYPLAERRHLEQRLRPHRIAHRNEILIGRNSAFDQRKRDVALVARIDQPLLGVHERRRVARRRQRPMPPTVDRADEHERCPRHYGQQRCNGDCNAWMAAQHLYALPRTCTTHTAPTPTMCARPSRAFACCRTPASPRNCLAISAI